MSHVFDAVQTIGVLLLGAGANYLRQIRNRLAAYERNQFRDELHILDHEQRLVLLGTWKGKDS